MLSRNLNASYQSQIPRVNAGKSSRFIYHLHVRKYQMYLYVFAVRSVVWRGCWIRIGIAFRN